MFVWCTLAKEIMRSLKDILYIGIRAPKNSFVWNDKKYIQPANKYANSLKFHEVYQIDKGYMISLDFILYCSPFSVFCYLTQAINGILVVMIYQEKFASFKTSDSASQLVRSMVTFWVAHRMHINLDLCKWIFMFVAH